jgi:hypothetical protein
MGGLGESKVEDRVNVEKLNIFLQMLNGGNKMRLIALGAVERLKRYTGTNTTTMKNVIVQYTDDPEGMWLYHLQEWMEHRHVQIRLTRVTTETRPALMDICTRKADQHEIWSWMRKMDIYWANDLIDAAGRMREGILDTANPTVKSAVKQQLREYMMQPEVKLVGNKRRILVGCRMMKVSSGRIGTVREVSPRGLVMDVANQGAHAHDTNTRRRRITQIWNAHTCEELSSAAWKYWLRDDSNVDKNYTMEGVNEINEEGPYSTTDDETSVLSHGRLFECPDNVTKLKNMTADDTITIVSDGSVRDSTFRGTWAWSLVMEEEGKPVLAGLCSVGKETITNSNLLTDEKHSYRMEALALLDGLTYLKNGVSWKGK